MPSASRASPWVPCLLWLVAFAALGVFSARALMTARDRGVEAAAAGSLRTLIAAQERFRERDGERDGKHDYGTLAELGAANEIDPALASGAKLGYAFDVRPSEDGARWLGIATPSGPAAESGTGCCQLAANQEGVVYQSWARPFAWNPECEIADRSLRAYAAPPWALLDRLLIALSLVASVLAIVARRRSSRAGAVARSGPAPETRP
ncbi:MAG: hypothetical protein AB7N76_28545 [Planctomycetota bacterium]